MNGRKSPLINRGYFTRVTTVDIIVYKFLSVGSNHQIVNLGCGLDTLIFKLKEKKQPFSKFVDVDLVPSIHKRIQQMEKHKDKLESLWGEENHFVINESQTELTISNEYYIRSVDLCDLDNLSELLFDSIGLNKEYPTLFISECVLVYIPVEKSNALIKWCSENFVNSVFTTYEQIKPEDPFGQVMIQNLIDRGCPLLSVEKYPTLESQKQRYIDLGYPFVEIEDMNTIYYEVIDPNEIQRISKIEIFDEFEEYHMMQSHYFFIVAKNSELYNAVTYYDKHTTLRPNLKSFL